MLESAYEACLLWELNEAGLKVDVQVPSPISYKGLQLDAGYRVDLIASDRVVVELKATEKILPIHVVQVLTYLKMTNMRMALILNFNVELMRSGIKRIINDY